MSFYLFLDPFADSELNKKGGAGQDGYIHIRIQQRNGRKTLTTVQGISPEFDLKKIVKVAKKVSLKIKLNHNTTKVCSTNFIKLHSISIQ